MKLRRREWLGTPALLLSLAASAHGQGQAGPPVWTVSVRASETYDSNQTFRARDDARPLVHRVGLGAGWTRTGGRSSLSLTGQASGVFHGIDAANRLSYLLNGQWSHRPSRSWNFSLSQSASSTLTRYAPFLLEEGLPLPLAQTRTYVTLANVAGRLSSRTTLRIAARRASVSFDRADLTGGAVMGAVVSLERGLDPRSSITARYGWRRSDRTANVSEAHTLDGGWSRSLSPTVRFDVHAGVTYFRVLGESEAGRFYPSGDVGLARVFERGSWSLGYSRFVTQSFGTGRDRLTDRVWARLARRLSRDVVLSVAASYSANRDPENPSRRFRTQLHDASIDYRVTRGLSIGATYQFALRKEGDGAAISDHAATLGIRQQWRFH